nr:hypothetical protein Itr_chr12CG14580 [Ipomoea trifida]
MAVPDRTATPDRGWCPDLLYKGRLQILVESSVAIDPNPDHTEDGTPEDADESIELTNINQRDKPTRT